MAQNSSNYNPDIMPDTPESPDTPDTPESRNRKKWQLSAVTAIVLLAAGIIMAFIALLLPPPGEIHDSVLYIFAQILIYCGSIFGIDSYISNLKSQLKKHE